MYEPEAWSYTLSLPHCEHNRMAAYSLKKCTSRELCGKVASELLNNTTLTSHGYLFPFCTLDNSFSHFLERYWVWVFLNLISFTAYEEASFHAVTVHRNNFHWNFPQFLRKSQNHKSLLFQTYKMVQVWTIVAYNFLFLQRHKTPSALMSMCTMC